MTDTDCPDIADDAAKWQTIYGIARERAASLPRENYFAQNSWLNLAGDKARTS